MTNTTRARSESRRRWLLGLAIGLTGCVSAIESKEKAHKMTTRQMTLWQLIDALAQQVPFSKIKVETVLATDLHEIRRTNHTAFFQGGGVELAQACKVARIDLRLGTEPKDPGFLVLDIEGVCIRIEDLRERYNTLDLTETPRGRSLDESTTYSVVKPWGKLSFGFKERKPDCLAQVALDPDKNR